MVRVIALASLGLCLFAGFGIPIAAAQAESASELVRAVNQFRTEHGKPPLEVHTSLMLAAQRQATWLAVNHVHSHMGEGGSMPQDRANAAGYPGYVLENVAGGTRGYVSIAWTIQGWAGSPGHRQTMLSDNLHIGAGIASNEAETMYLLLVGSPSQRGRAPAPRGGLSPVPSLSKASPTPPAVVAVPIVVATPLEDGAIFHIVQPGQSLWDIAARYHVPLADLLALNHLERDDLLRPGDRILVKLGQGQAPPPPPTRPAVHIVREGETLWTIAVLYDMKVDELLALNGLQRGAVIRPGDKLTLSSPQAAATPTSAPTPVSPLTPPETASYPALLTSTETPTPPDAGSALQPEPSQTRLAAAIAAPTDAPTVDLAPVRENASSPASALITALAVVLLAASLVAVIGGVVRRLTGRGEGHPGA